VNSTAKTIIFWVVIIFSAVVLWVFVKQAQSGQKVQEMNITQFMTDVEQGAVKEINVTGAEIKGKKTDGSAFHLIAPNMNYFTPEMVKLLHDKGVQATFQDVSSGSWGWIIQLLPLGLLAALPVTAGDSRRGSGEKPIPDVVVYVADSNVVDRHIRNLRAKLRDDWRHPRYVATVSGRGYRFLQGAVEEESPEQSDQPDQPEQSEQPEQSDSPLVQP